MQKPYMGLYYLHPPHLIHMLHINLLNATRFERISLVSEGRLGGFEMYVS